MINSLIIAGCSAVLSTYFSTMTAYAIHVYDFKLKKFMFTFILMIMTIPTQVTALGFIQLVDNMGLDDTFIPLIVPSIAAPVVFFYMKQYMESSLPLSLVEAARIDGSGEFRTFNSIVLPLMKPAIAVQAIFTFVSSWNNYFTPALILHSDNKKTLPILIAQLRSADFLKFDMGQVYVMILFSILPVVIVYLFLSKNIVGGVALGGVKG
jgi:multiple sugar transport system permease protein